MVSHFQGRKLHSHLEVKFVELHDWSIVGSIKITEVSLSYRAQLTRSVVPLNESNDPIIWPKNSSPAVEIMPSITLVSLGNMLFGGIVNPDPGIRPGGKGSPGGNMSPGGKGFPGGNASGDAVATGDCWTTPRKRPDCVGISPRGLAPGDPSATSGPCGVPGSPLGRVAVTPVNVTSTVFSMAWLAAGGPTGPLLLGCVVVSCGSMKRNYIFNTLRPKNGQHLKKTFLKSYCKIKIIQFFKFHKRVSQGFNSQ